ncbi:hypothetical protein [Roseivirga sp.]|uniref:hypothetical protein n=1 Tax=Roseivirga sp. TaxID=1964215 RepID=UPI003B52ACE4
MKNYKLLIVALAFLTIISGCEDLEVENLNNPNRQALLANPAEYPASINGAYSAFWAALQQSSPNFPLSVMAQGPSMSWGNWGARDLGTIPRQSLQNNLTYSNRAIFTQAWNGLYSAIGPVNNILGIIAEDDVTVPDANGVDITDQVVANGKALQGLVMGYLSLLYDQAYITDETTDPTSLSFSPYGDVNDAAIAKLQEAIALFAGSNNVLTGFNQLTYTGDDAANLLRGFIAKFEALQARNTTEASAVDWNRVLSNSANSVDLAPVGDGGFTWWHRLLIQGQDALWARVSQKVIKMMNPSKTDAEVPYPWPDGLAVLPEISNPDDSRLGTDITYAGAPDFSAARGYYFFSTYDYSRYESYRAGFTDPMVFLSSEEVDLLQAEALVRTGGNKVAAAGLINNTRVNRGGLAPLTGLESDADLLNAILYERIVEFTWHGSCNIWFHRRMMTPAGNTDATNLYYLEPASARHLPVPADELSIFGLPFYTFGGNQPEQ